LKQEESLWVGRDDREAKGALPRIYGNQSNILREWGRLEEALALHKKQEAICLELGDKVELLKSYGNQAVILRIRGRLEEAMVLHKKEEDICLELGNKDGLQISYGNQALILNAWGGGRRRWRCTRRKKPSAWSWATRMDCRPATGTRR
jgi:tetratricopeptide (TPR) repeat protein